VNFGGNVALFGRRLVDAVNWSEEPGVLAWRWRAGDAAIRHGAMLTVREGQHAVLLHEGVEADQFEAGAYRLETGELPLLAGLLGGLSGGFQTDVLFFAMRRLIDRRWGTPQPIAVRDPDFGMLRVRAFGRYSYGIGNVERFRMRVLGSLDRLTVDDLEPQLRASIATALASRLGCTDAAFLDMAATQSRLSDEITADLAPMFDDLGLALAGLQIESLSVPDAVQQAMDTRAAAAGAPADMDDVLVAIERLHALHLAGALTEAEFTARKTALLARLG
jgi:membrane protease subunit (stomatin/prohibitin family)